MPHSNLLVQVSLVALVPKKHLYEIEGERLLLFMKFHSLHLATCRISLTERLAVRDSACFAAFLVESSLAFSPHCVSIHHGFFLLACPRLITYPEEIFQRHKEQSMDTMEGLGNIDIPAGLPYAEKKERAHTAAFVGNQGDSACGGGANTGVAKLRRRSRSASSAAEETCSGTICCATLHRAPTEQKPTEILPVSAFEIAVSDDECAGEDVAGDAAHVAEHFTETHAVDICSVVAENEQEGVPPSKASLELPTARVEASKDAGSNPHSVVVYVPTMFTTAAGRTICVRERRTIDKGSPYWPLLSFSPERHANMRSVPRSEATEQRTNERPPSADDDVSLQRERNERLDEEDWGLTSKLLGSTRVGTEWLNPRPVRASSCPERYHLRSTAVPQDEATYTLPAFTGFCAASGRPFFDSVTRSHQLH